MALSSNMDMGIRGTGSGGNCDEELKTQFMTREGIYRLMTLSEYSRPNRVGYEYFLYVYLYRVQGMKLKVGVLNMYWGANKWKSSSKLKGLFSKVVVL